MSAVTITLNGEPKGKGRARFVKATGRPFTPAATRSYEAALRYAAQEEMGERLPYDGAVVVSIQARFPVPASWSKKKRAAALNGSLPATCKPDADNLMKVLDALNEVVFVDDKQVVFGSVWKMYHQRPALIITVSPWGPDEGFS